MKTWYYVTKLDTVIKDGLMKGIYVETTDNTLKKLSIFQDILYENVDNYEHNKVMQSGSNQPACLYGTAKTHIFKILKSVTIGHNFLRI